MLETETTDPDLAERRELRRRLLCGCDGCCCRGGVGLVSACSSSTASVSVLSRPGWESAKRKRGGDTKGDGIPKPARPGRPGLGQGGGVSS